ncbi:MAG: NTP transferase domain-containing protein [Candidatus Peribacteraceae bacterium]|nr:NTP transferase domain-containing protein [Candidatus Peribacteraceae bacterium]
MKTFLLAAGRSRRFWPLTEKNFVPLLGKPLLQHQLERLKEGGCKDITVVNGNHNVAQLQTLFPGVPFIEQENLDLGMQGALLSALGGLTEPVLVVGGNDVIEPEAYRALLAAASKKGVDGAILARKVDRYFPGGYLTVSGEKISGIVEKPGEGKEPSDLVNIVAHIHNDPSSLLRELRGASPDQDDGYERALATLFKMKNYVAVPYEGSWQAVKYPWHLLPLLDLLLKDITKPQISKKARIHPSAAIEGPVVIEDGARIFAHAAITGPCYIGKNATVGSGALVRGSSVGEGCVVGFGSEVKGSILMKDVWTHMAYVGDSVCGENVSFGGGSVTGNLRLDEGEISSAVGGDPVPTGLSKFGTIIGDGCRIGIQAGTDPGVKIGGGSFIAGGAYLTEDIPDRSFVRMKDGKAVVRENRVHVPAAAEREKYRPGK